MASLVDYDSDSTSSSDEATAPQVTKESLPSVAHLFSSAVKTSFLDGRNGKPEVDYKAHMSEIAKAAETEAADSVPAADPSASPADSGVGSKRPREPESTASASDGPPPQATKKGPPRNPAEKPAHTNYKDKVKRQRLSGQSGIGEDFRTWRTDEEMALRQQFDA